MPCIAALQTTLEPLCHFPKCKLYIYFRDNRATTTGRSGMLSIAPFFSTHIPAA